MTTIYTIGHSNHSGEKFVALLLEHGVACLADVRSRPYSRYNPQFNRETLKQAAEAAGIRYAFFGESLGGRPNDPSLYDEGNERPTYSRQRETALYREGVARLAALAAQAATAMMCSEGDPETCHRTLLITPSLLDLGLEVQHIYPDGHLEKAEPPMKQLGLDY